MYEKLFLLYKHEFLKKETKRKNMKKIYLYLGMHILIALRCTASPIQEIFAINNVPDAVAYLQGQGISKPRAIMVDILLQLKDAYVEAEKGNKQTTQALLVAAKTNISTLRNEKNARVPNQFISVLSPEIETEIMQKITQKIQEKTSNPREQAKQNVQEQHIKKIERENKAKQMLLEQQEKTLQEKTRQFKELREKTTAQTRRIEKATPQKQQEKDERARLETEKKQKEATEKERLEKERLEDERLKKEQEEQEKNASRVKNKEKQQQKKNNDWKK